MRVELIGPIGFDFRAYTVDNLLLDTLFLISESLGNGMLGVPSLRGSDTVCRIIWRLPRICTQRREPEAALHVHHSGLRT
jgi:hypothetical protein